MNSENIPYMEEPFFKPTQRAFPAEALPEVVFAEKPNWEHFYKEAWRIAWKHVYESNAIHVSPYMGEGCGVNRVWIWDTCFMVNFCRYAFKQYPGIQSIDNFYKIFYENNTTDIKVHHPDNPPLFAWAEYLYFQMSGDLDRIHFVLEEKQYLQRHYLWLESIKERDFCPPFAACLVKWKACDKGYQWSGCPSGMDNTPRGRGDYNSIYWVDALAQQAMSALYIIKLAESIGNQEIADQFKEEYAKKKKMLQYYWDPETGFFFDRYIANGEFCRVVTPASYWVMMAEAASPEQAKQMGKMLLDPDKLGGKFPIPTIAHDDPDFVANGEYWKGSIWLPTSYMTIKALEKYGEFELAQDLTGKLLDHMETTYRDFTPHTIWECYCPVDYMPAKKNSRNEWVRKDFCGWSALGPISLFIENIVGVHDVSAKDHRISWRVTHTCRHGIKKLKIGDDTVSIIYENGKISAEATSDYTLIVNGKEYQIQKGNTDVCLSMNA